MNTVLAFKPPTLEKHTVRRGRPKNAELRTREHLTEAEVQVLTVGFSHFVASMTAPVASGWSGRRVGLASTGKRRLVTAHTLNGLRSALPNLDGYRSVTLLMG